MTIAELCNRFQTFKLRSMEANELSPRSFAEYKVATDLIVSTFGKRWIVSDLLPDDFQTLRAAMAKKWGQVSIVRLEMLETKGFR